jgi:hypothetical protein
VPFRQAITSPAFNRLAYLGPLRALVRELLGPVSFPYPVKVLRTVYPEPGTEVTRGRYVHQDYGVAGVQDMLTTWLQLMDVALQAADYQPGDVLVFHCPGYRAGPPGPSRFFPVHPRWRYWRPPAGQVH